MKIRISGKAFGVVEGSELYYNPEKYTSGPKLPAAREAHKALREGIWWRSGRGQSFIIDDISPEAVGIFEEYFRTMGEIFTQGGYDDGGATYDEGYACLEVANRLRKQLEELTS